MADATTRGFSGEDLLQLAAMADVFDHNGDDIEPPDGWCYVNGAAFAEHCRDLARRLAPYVERPPEAPGA